MHIPLVLLLYFYYHILSIPCEPGRCFTTLDDYKDSAPFTKVITRLWEHPHADLWYFEQVRSVITFEMLLRCMLKIT